MDDISRVKGALRKKQRELRDLLCEWDPIGVVTDFGDLRDEYDCLLGIVGDLRQGMTEDELAAYLEEQLREHFGLDPAPHRPLVFAHRVFTWYWSSPLPGSVSD